MPVIERVHGLGDWSIGLKESTPPAIRQRLAVPFAQLVITRARIAAPLLSDTIVYPQAIYSGIVLRPGPQLELGGAGLAWYLGDDAGGAGFLDSGISFASGTTLSSALASALSGTGFTTATVGAGSLSSAWAAPPQTRRDLISYLAYLFGYEWRIRPNNVIDVSTVASIYGATPTGVITRREAGRGLGAVQGIVGAVGSTWDWERYGSKAIVWSNVGSGSSGGASPYRDQIGNLMTITRGFEYADAPLGSEATIAAWWLSQINRSVRTVEVTSTDYAITGRLPCGGQVYLYDRDQGLVDTANPVQFGGGVIWPVSARVVGITWPVERGLGVYFRYHTGSAAVYIDLTDYVDWEPPGARFDISTGAQQLAPPSQAPPLSAFFSPWQVYPSAEWRAVSVNPTIGNGSITASFRRLGTRLEINGKITAGSTTTFGTGEWRITLPPGCTTRSDLGKQIGPAFAYVTNSATHEYSCEVWAEAGATELRCMYPGSGVAASVTSGFAVWTTGDRFEWNITLEIQP